MAQKIICMYEVNGRWSFFYDDETPKFCEDCNLHAQPKSEDPVEYLSSICTAKPQPAHHLTSAPVGIIKRKTEVGAVTRVQSSRWLGCVKSGKEIDRTVRTFNSVVRVCPSEVLNEERHVQNGNHPLTSSVPTGTGSCLVFSHWKITRPLFTLARTSEGL